MVENQENKAQADNSDSPKSKAKADVTQVITRKNSPESRVEYEPPKDETFEKQPTNAQVTSQITGGGDLGDSSTAKQNIAGQAGEQATTNVSRDPLTSLSDEEFQKVKEEQKQKDEQKYQEWKGKLQQVQKSEQQAQDAHSETDQDEEYYYGQGL